MICYYFPIRNPYDKGKSNEQNMLLINFNTLLYPLNWRVSVHTKGVSSEELFQFNLF